MGLDYGVTEENLLRVLAQDGKVVLTRSHSMRWRVRAVLRDDLPKRVEDLSADARVDWGFHHREWLGSLGWAVEACSRRFGEVTVKTDAWLVPTFAFTLTAQDSWTLDARWEAELEITEAARGEVTDAEVLGEE